MAETNDIKIKTDKVHDKDALEKLYEYYDKYEINKVCDEVWIKIQSADKYIQENQPFKTIKGDKEKGKEQISYLLKEVFIIGKMLSPIMPGTSSKIAKAIDENKISEPLFMRK